MVFWQKINCPYTEQYLGTLKLIHCNRNIPAKIIGMLLTTTDQIPNLPIQRYFGVISATAFVGGDEREVLIAALDAAADGLTAPYERLEQEARRLALDFLRYKATELQADAIIGLRIEHRIMDPNRSLAMIFVAGTAVQTSAAAQPRQADSWGQNPGW